MKRGKYDNLRHIAIFVTLVFIVFLMIFKFIISDKIEKNTIVDLKKETTSIAKETQIFFNRYSEIIEQMLTNKYFEEYIIKAETDGLNNDLESITRETLKRIKETDDNIELAWIGLFDENDLISDDYDWKVNEGYEIKKRPWYKELDEKEKSISFATPYKDESTKELIVSVMAPIYIKGKMVGNVGLDIKIDDMVKFISEYRVKNKGETILLSREKEIIAYSGGKRIDKKVLKYILENNIEDECTTTELGTGKESLYFTTEKIASNNWLVGTIIAKSETRYFINLFNILTYIIFAIFIIMVIVLGILLKVSTNFSELNILYDKLNKREKELKHSNQEMQAAYEQLAASEEELKYQYKSIQEYVKKMEELKNKYDLAIELTNISVWDYDIKTKKVRFSNPFFSDGKFIEEVYYNINEYMKENLDEYNMEVVNNSFKNYLNGKSEDLYCQLNFNNKWYLLQGRFCCNNNTNLGGTFIDITKIKNQELAIEKMANIDPLTNIPNRRNFKSVLIESISKGYKGAVILMDLDNFKEINDTLGHVFGDAVLKIVAEKLSNIRKEDFRVSRFGGDEFLIEINKIKDEQEVIEIIQNIIDKFKTKIKINNENVFISMSLGVTLYPKDSIDVDELIMNADLAMYSVKASGKNNYAFYSVEMRNEAKEKNRIERVLRKALDNNLFKMLYQPQVSVKTGEVCSYEALIRLKDYSISPGEFIPVAEESDLIIKIGRWVTKTVINQLSKWQEQGFELKPVSINFSAKQMLDENYFEFLKKCLDEGNVNAKYIEIEITEGILLEEKEETIELLNKFKEIGITLALDDFGMGYSSLNYLTYLPLDRLKLDKSLSDKFLETEYEGVIKNIIALAHTLNLKVIAEGIEQEEQFKKIYELYGDIIQGYYFSKPLNEKEVLKIKNYKLPENLA